MKLSVRESIKELKQKSKIIINSKNKIRHLKAFHLIIK